jgi:hypothetical protein
MADTNKDTIYIDIDDEITAIIDKVQASSGKVVALVLPKRATTLQSIVNMKLLKRTADTTKKNVVLITTESGLLPLAGAVGLHVAKTPSSRPEVPMAPDAISDREEQVDEDADLLDEDELPAATAQNAGNKSVGELAAATMPLPSRPKPESGIETLELDNEDKAAIGASAAAATLASAPKAAIKKDKKLHIPDFDRFRMALIFGGLLLLILVVGGYFALVVMPKASIAIKTNASNVNTDVDFTLSTAATSLSTTSNTMPAKQAQVQKTLTGSAPATGQKNNGDKAAGNVTISAQECGVNALNDPTLAAGSGISSNGLTYITQESAKFSSSGKDSKCFYYKSNPVSIKAQNGGAKYNAGSGTTFTASGHGDFTSITGSTSGGTDDIQTIVGQADIDSAKGKISSGENSSQEELKDQLTGQGLFAIAATYNAGTPTSTNSANVGDAASSVTVTQTITYTMLGINEAHIKTLVDNDIKGQIDTSSQDILSQGITQAAFKVKSLTSTGATMNIQTVAEVGPAISVSDIAKDAAGKKSGEIKSAIKANPDVTDVTIKLSPFWVTKAPKNVTKITVTVAKPTKTADAN